MREGLMELGKTYHFEPGPNDTLRSSDKRLLRALIKSPEAALRDIAVPGVSLTARDISIDAQGRVVIGLQEYVQSYQAKTSGNEGSAIVYNMMNDGCYQLTITGLNVANYYCN